MPPMLTERSDRHRIYVIVQAHASRPTLRQTIASLEDSDLGGADKVLMQLAEPSREAMRRHFIRTMREIAGCGREYALRLEDDVVVNQYICENLMSWRVTSASDFGAGWLWRSPYVKRKTADALAVRGQVTGSLGVLIRPAVAARCLERLAEERLWESAEREQDRALSQSLCDLGYRVYFHEPPLIEHIGMTSTIPTATVLPRSLQTTGGAFSRDWRRSG